MRCLDRSAKPRRCGRAREVRIAYARPVARRRHARPADTASSHLLVRCAIRYCVRFHTILYSRKLIVIRDGSAEPHAPVNEHGRRGYCVGFPRTGLLTSTSPQAAAKRVRAAADSLASTLRCTAAHSSSVRDEPNLARGIASVVRAPRVATTRIPLLHEPPGRHALDQTGGARAAHASIGPTVRDVAVKNLRIVALAVLLLNFNEVRSLHLCTTGVTM